VAINLWNSKSLEYAVKNVSYTQDARLNGAVEKEVKRTFVASHAIITMIVS